MEEIILITGTSAGFGQTTGEALAQRSPVYTTLNFGDIMSTFLAVQITHRKKLIVRYAGCVSLEGRDHS
jgi:hypothetical protein